MCRKEKNPKDEIVSRLKNKYMQVMNGEKDVFKIAFFTQYVLEAIADPDLIPNTNQKMYGKIF